jgi:hypothetical protein
MELKSRKHMAEHRIKVSFFTRLGVCLLLFLPIFSFSAYAEPPVNNECLAYGYTESDNHLFLLGNNKTAFGSNITIEHNCDYIEVFTNGNFTAYSENQRVIIPTSPGIYDIQIKSTNFSKNITGFTLLPDRLQWEFQYYEWQNEFDFTIEEYITLTSATAKANWASILSIVVVFCLVTMVYWHLINSYIDRNYCEEVKS